MNADGDEGFFQFEHRVYGREGDDTFVFDDTDSALTVYGDAGNDFFQIRLQPLELTTGACGGIKIANLFQPKYQLENMLDGDALAHLRELQHAFIFRRLVTLPLDRKSVV